MAKAGARGIAGMIIVQAHRDEDVHAGLYDSEHELFVQDYFHSSPYSHYTKHKGGLHPQVTLSKAGHVVGIFPWESGLINGKGGHYGDE